MDAKLLVNNARNFNINNVAILLTMPYVDRSISIEIIANGMVNFVLNMIFLVNVQKEICLIV